jgi:hypothetical protein
MSRALNMRMSGFLLALWRPFAAGLAMAAVVLAANAEIAFSGPARLILDVALGATTFGLAIFALWLIVGRPDGPETVVWARASRWLPLLRIRAENSA